LTSFFNFILTEVAISLMKLMAFGLLIFPAWRNGNAWYQGGPLSLGFRVGA
jgi:hypothetical protein